MKQVDKNAYDFDKYVYFDRWASYYYQIKEILVLQPQTLLEVGVGDGVLKQYLTHNSSITYTNIDIAEDLEPDIIGSIDNLPCASNSFDVIVAFEVLEHIPFEQFEQSIKELQRVSKKNVIISIPHFGPPLQFELKIPFFPRIEISFKIPFPKTHSFNGQHYWELGKRGYPPQRIRAILKKYFTITKEFIPFENQYHHFFVLEKHEKNN